MREEAGQRLVLALLEQWFWLADETSLRQVVEHVLLLVQQTVDHAALTHLLRTFAQAFPEQAVPAQSRHVADLLLTYCETDLSYPPPPERFSTLLARLSQPAGFPASLQARIVGRRAAASLLQDQPRLALADGIRAVTLDPTYVDGHLLQGIAAAALGEGREALVSLNQAISLDVGALFAYGHRSLVHLAQKAYEQAVEDANRVLLLAWVRLCQGEPDDEICAWLETLAASIEAQDLARICHSIVLLLHQQFEEARASLEQILQHNPEQREAAFWKGFACVFLRRDEEALAALERARSAAIPLPAVLFTPLRRVASVRPAFYQEQLLPLLQAAEPRKPVI